MTKQVESDIIHKISLYQLAPSKTNPRKVFYDRDMAELKMSIKTKGQIEPALVRPDADGFEIVSGERRFKCLLDLKAETMDCIIKHLTDDEVLEIQLIDHLTKAKISSIEESAAILELSKKLSIDQICSKLSQSRSFILNRMKLNDLIPKLKKAIDKHFIPESFGQIISKETKDVQEQIHEWLECEKGLTNKSLKELKEYLHDNFHLSLSSAPFKWKDETLYKKAGSCNNCPKRSGSQPELFNDISKTNICLDVQCFNKKVDLHIERELKNNKDLLQLSSSYYIPPAQNKDGKILPTSKYMEKKYHEVEFKRNKNLIKKGIIVHGYNRYDFGKIIPVLLNYDLAKNKNENNPEVVQDRKRKAALQLRLKTRTAANYEILKSVVNNVKERYKSGQKGFDTYTGDEKKSIMMQLWNSIGHDNHMVYFKGHPDFHVSNGSFGKDYHASFRKIYEKEAAGDWKKFNEWYFATMIELTLIHDVKAREYVPSIGTELRKAAKKIYKINVSKIDRDIKKKLTPKSKAAADKKKKPAAKKRTAKKSSKK